MACPLAAECHFRAFTARRDTPPHLSLDNKKDLRHSILVFTIILPSLLSPLAPDLLCDTPSWPTVRTLLDALLDRCLRTWRAVIDLLGGVDIVSFVVGLAASCEAQELSVEVVNVGHFVDGVLNEIRQWVLDSRMWRLCVAFLRLVPCAAECFLLCIPVSGKG